MRFKGGAVLGLVGLVLLAVVVVKTLLPALLMPNVTGTWATPHEDDSGMVGHLILIQKRNQITGTLRVTEDMESMGEFPIQTGSIEKNRVTLAIANPYEDETIQIQGKVDGNRMICRVSDPTTGEQSEEEVVYTKVRRTKVRAD